MPSENRDTSQRHTTDVSNADDGSSRIGILGRYHHSRYRSGYTAFLSSMPQTPMSILSGTYCKPPFLIEIEKAPVLFCYAQCNTGAFPFKLFSCFALVKKALDEQQMLPSLPRNIEAVLRDEEVCKAYLRDQILAGDVERLELLHADPAVKGCVAVAGYINHIYDCQEITVGFQLMINQFAEGFQPFIGELTQLCPIGNARGVMTGASLIPIIGSVIDLRV